MSPHDPERTADHRELSSNGTPTPQPSTVPPGPAAAAVPRAISAPNGYELGEEIGRGGMGIVYRARDTGLSRDVAVKVLADKFSPDSGTARRFLAEARITGQLQHPGIPAVHQVGTLPDGRPFLAMKLIKGRTLHALVRESSAADRGRLLPAFEQLCQAVGYAHAHRVIHRDLKPANVMVGAFGEVQVMDWGLAKVLASGRREPTNSPPDEPLVTEIDSARDADSDTRAGSMMGTPAFMPPEQAGGEVERIDERADVFGLGAVLCVILTGEPPYEARNAEGVRLKAVRGELGDCFARLDFCSAEPDLVALAKRCLARERDDRPANAGEVARAVAELRAAAEQRARQAELDRTRAEVRAAEQRKRRRAQSLALGGLVVVLLAGIAGTYAGKLKAERAEGREAAQRGKAEKARDRTREALDAMTSAVTGDSLATQKQVSAEQKKFLSEVLAYYREFAGEQADDEPSRVRTAGAASRVSHIEHRLGRKAEAAAAERLALDGYAALAADFPAVPEYRAALATSHNNLGIELADLGRHAEAEEHYRQAFAIKERLAADYPAAPEYRRDLAISHNSLGKMLANLGRHAEAEEQFRKALALQGNLAGEYPAVPEYRRDLAISHNNLGKLLDGMGKRTPAEEQYRKALALRERLAADSPAVPEYRRDLAGSHNGLGLLLYGLGKRSEAEEQSRRALALLDRLAADYPAVPEYRRDLAMSHNFLAVLLAGLGKGVEAEQQYRQALVDQERLAADFPAVPDYRSALAGSHNNLGFLLAGLGRRAEAEEQYRKALALEERLAADHPAVPDYQLDLAGSYCNIGSLVRDGGRAGESLAWFEKAVRTLTAVSRQTSSLAVAKEFLRNSHWGRARAYDRLHRYAEAVRDWDKAIDLSPPREQPDLRAARANARVRAGQAAEAVAEAADLTRRSDWDAGAWYNFACIYSLASGKEMAKREEYTDRAMELLQKAVTAGWKDADHLAKDTDLDPLRQREDFRKLLATLRAKAPATAPPPEPEK